MIDLLTSEEKDHAKYSASGSERWLQCPGSISLAEKAPPERESQYALEGTRAHACFEFFLNGGSKAVARKTWPKEMVDHGLAAVAWVRSRAEELPGSEIQCEQRVDASPFTCAGQFGTLDAAVIQDFGRLVVVDYKYGAGIGVDPAYQGEANSQLAYYALALSHQYGHNFTEVELVVIQPRAYHESGETVRTHVMATDELRAWEPRFRQGVVRAEAPNPLFASGRWCRFCRAATICPELKDAAMKDAQVAFAGDKGLIKAPTPSLIALPDLGTVLAACEKLESWIEKVREHAFGVLEDGGRIDGWKLVEKRPQRKWADEEAAAAEAFKVWGEDIFEEPKLLSPAQFEKKFKDKDWVEAHTIKESSGTKLAPESDKAPAVNRTAAADVFAEPPRIEKALVPVVLSGGPFKTRKKK